MRKETSSNDRRVLEFHPSEAEFANFAEYVSKIEPEARKYGICKVVPPPGK